MSCTPHNFNMYMYTGIHEEFWSQKCDFLRIIIFLNIHTSFFHKILRKRKLYENFHSQVFNVYIKTAYGMKFCSEVFKKTGFYI